MVMEIGIIRVFERQSAEALECPIVQVFLKINPAKRID